MMFSGNKSCNITLQKGYSDFKISITKSVFTSHEFGDVTLEDILQEEGEFGCGEINKAMLKKNVKNLMAMRMNLKGMRI